MSKYRLRINFTADTTAHIQALRSSIAGRLVGKDIYEQHGFSVDGNSLSGEWRFNRLPHRNDVRDWTISQVRDHPVMKDWIVPGSLQISWHRCTHDDADVKDCTTTEYEEVRV